MEIGGWFEQHFLGTEHEAKVDHRVFLTYHLEMKKKKGAVVFLLVNKEGFIEKHFTQKVEIWDGGSDTEAKEYLCRYMQRVLKREFNEEEFPNTAFYVSKEEKTFKNNTSYPLIPIPEFFIKPAHRIAVKISHEDQMELEFENFWDFYQENSLEKFKKEVNELQKYNVEIYSKDQKESIYTSKQLGGILIHYGFAKRKEGKIVSVFEPNELYKASNTLSIARALLENNRNVKDKGQELTKRSRYYILSADGDECRKVSQNEAIELFEKKEAFVFSEYVLVAS